MRTRCVGGFSGASNYSIFDSKQHSEGSYLELSDGLALVVEVRARAGAFASRSLIRSHQPVSRGNNPDDATSMCYLVGDNQRKNTVCRTSNLVMVSLSL